MQFNYLVNVLLRSSLGLHRPNFNPMAFSLEGKIAQVFSTYELITIIPIFALVMEWCCITS
jgi:hypothetical protein